VDLDLQVGAPGTPQVGAHQDVDDVDGGFDDGFVEEAPPVDAATVKVVLMALGSGVNALAGDDDVPGQWKFTPGELDAIAPPLTNIINARPKLRAAVARGDYMVVGIHLAGYAGRNLGAGSRAKEQRERDGEAAGSMEPWLPAGGPAGGQPNGGNGPVVRDGVARG